MQDDQLVSQFASLVEFMSEDIQQHIDEFRVIADCSVTPTDLISWLGSFVDAPVTEALDEHDRRRLLADLGQGLRPHRSQICDTYHTECKVFHSIIQL